MEELDVDLQWGWAQNYQYRESIIMKNKLPQSRMTSATSPITQEKQHQSKHTVENWKTGRTGLINTQDPILPLKFGKERIRKETGINLLTETVQNPEKLGIKTYKIANESHVFEDEMHFLNQSAVIGMNPFFIFNNSRYIQLSKPGQYSHLKQESYQFSSGNKGRIAGGQSNIRGGKSNIYSRGNPIVEGEVNAKHNLTLTNTWKEERRQRDNGTNCANTLQWDCQLKKRQFRGSKTYTTHRQSNKHIQ